ADQLWVGDVADIEIDRRRGVSHRGHLAVRADAGRSMKALRPFPLGLARLLSRHPPATGFSWPCRIADVQNLQDVRAESRRACRQIGVLAARIRVAVRPGRPRLPVRELPRVDRIADVPNQNAFVVWLVRIGAPSKRRLLQRRYHDVIVERHLDGPGVTGTRDGFHEFRILRIGNVHDAPAVMPQMPHVEVPMAIDLLNGHLEGALAVVESAISDGLHVVGFPSRWDGIGVAARRQPRGSDRNGAACGSASERFREAHPIPPCCGQWPILESIPMKWNWYKLQRGALPVRICLIWIIAQFHSAERGCHELDVRRASPLFARCARRGDGALLAAGPVERKPAWARTSALPVRTWDDRSHRTSSGSTHESAILAVGKTRRAHLA